LLPLIGWRNKWINVKIVVMNVTALKVIAMNVLMMYAQIVNVKVIKIYQIVLERKIHNGCRKLGYLY
jgi:hypothetical protein